MASPIDRFMAKVSVDQDTGCWLWTARKTHEGYGWFYSKGGSTLAHRWIVQHHVGGIPDGYEVDHLCYVPSCVNPDHLEAVTPAENMRRRYARMTHCKHGHPFDEENTYWRPTGHRDCRECVRGRARRYQQRKRAA